MYSRLHAFVVLVFLGCSQEHHPLQRDVPITKTIEASPTPPVPVQACPIDMVEIEGEFCPNVEKVCLHFVKTTYHDKIVRCGEWKQPRCLSKTQHQHYCIDRYEYPNIAGTRPQSWMSWLDAKQELEVRGKRMCTMSEWTFACQGPDMHFYPYGDGFHRDNTACNFDNPLPKDVTIFQAKKAGDATALVLDDLLIPSGSNHRCVSEWGVYDMVGNIDEWVKGTGKMISGLMSGHVFGVQNNCVAMTLGHGPGFAWYETGTRGCKDVTEEK